MIVPNDNRRRHPRIAVEAPVSVTEVASGVRRAATLNDLSGGGMSFHSDSAFAVGAVLHVAIEPVLTITPPLYALTTVVRCVPSRGQYQVAVATRTMGSQPCA